MTQDKVEIKDLVLPVELAGKLDQADVLSIVVAEAETTYDTEIAAGKAELIANKKLRAEKEKVLAARLKSDLESGVDISALKGAVSAFGGEVLLEVNNGESNSQCSFVRGTVKAYQTKTDPKETYYGRNMISFQVQADLSKETLAVRDELRAAEAETTRIADAILSSKQKKQNIPTLERRFRARIATAKLKSSEDGQRLLAALRVDLQEQILALPG